MSCRLIYSNLSAYVDNEVDAELAAKIRIHLEKCHRCRHEEYELRNLKSLLGASSCPELDPEFEVRLQQWLSDPAKPSRSTTLVRTVSVGIIAPVCLLAIWLVTETVTVAPKPIPHREMSVAGSFDRDQVYDLMQSEPQYGAPVITAVDYAR